MQQQLYPLVIKPSFKIRNQIINEDRLNRDIDNFHPKQQLRVLQSYMSREQIQQKLLHRKEILRTQATHALRNFKHNMKQGHRNTILGAPFLNPFISYSGFNKTGLKAYYKFNAFEPSVAVSFSDDFSSTTGWTQTGTLVTIQTGTPALNYNAATNGTDRRLTKSLGLTLSDTNWVAYFRYNWSASNIPSHFIMYFVSAVGEWDATTADVIGVTHDDTGTGTLKLGTKDSVTGPPSSSSSTIATSASTEYDIYFERQSATLAKLTVLTTAGVNVAAPVTLAIASTCQGLANIQSSTYAAGSSARSLTANIKNLKIWNSTNLMLENMATSVGSGDSLGTAANGTLNGTIDLVAGKIDNAYKFNGSSGYSQLGTSLSQFNFLHNTNALWSMAFWIKYSALPSGTQAIFSTFKSSGSRTGMTLFSLTRQVYLDIQSSAGTSTHGAGTSSTFLPNDTNWHFLVVTYDQSLGSANGVYMVDDGTAETTNKTGNTPASNDAQDPARFASTSQPDSYLAASLDEFSIWNRILTADEKTSLYNGGNGRAIT